MCGVTGLWLRRAELGTLTRSVEAMTGALRRRGPDDSGVWLDPTSEVALGHRRLSIVDLSRHGHQPMASHSGRYQLSYNGEIYNARALRDELEQSGSLRGPWRGSSDTEVLLAAIEAYGLSVAVKKLIGMFAFALWDCEQRKLFLVRDRLGVKPLCYGVVDGSLAFASELRAFSVLDGFRRQIDRVSLDQFFRNGCVGGARTIYEDARKVPPGTILEFDGPSLSPSRVERYWDAAQVVRVGLEGQFRGNFQDAVDAVEELLLDSVRLRLVADVPVGAFLSGGIDSASVVAMMRACGGRIRTYTVGFREREVDESRNAARVARHFETEHTSLLVSASDAMAVLREMPSLYDEPFADSSQVPMFLVSRLAERDVKVALSGDGGDELFGGYNRHVWAPRVWQFAGRVGAPLRGVAARLARGPLARLGEALPGPMLAKLPIRQLGDKLRKLGNAAGAATLAELYAALRLLDGAPFNAEPHGFEKVDARATPAEEIMYWDLISYLPDDILTKVDRATMAVSLEAREPLLDHRLVELAWSLPLNYKVQGTETKRALRAALHRHIPKALVDQPKSGFAIPINRWLRNELSDWAESLIADAAGSGHLDATRLRQVWALHRKGKLDAGPFLWAVIVFESWRQRTGAT
jgi:asparagine synthase (glutamine-hydrolysing)